MSRDRDRFYVDQRVGCIAVVDSDLFPKNYNGLHQSTRGVMQFWAGRRVRNGFDAWDWEVPLESITEAHQLCDSLNAEENSVVEKLEVNWAGYQHARQITSETLMAGEEKQLTADEIRRLNTIIAELENAASLYDALVSEAQRRFRQREE